MSQARGFTFIELLIVLGIMAILGVVVAPLLGGNISSSELQSSAWEVVDDLRRARTSSMTAQNNSNWGVHFQADQHVLFQGATYNPVDPNNIVTMLPNSISISGISLNGAGNDVRFTRIRGTTTDFGTITLLDSNSNATATISINEAGRVQQN